MIKSVTQSFWRTISQGRFQLDFLINLMDWFSGSSRLIEVSQSQIKSPLTRGREEGRDNERAEKVLASPLHHWWNLTERSPWSEQSDTKTVSKIQRYNLHLFIKIVIWTELTLSNWDLGRRGQFWSRRWHYCYYCYSSHQFRRFFPLSWPGRRAVRVNTSGSSADWRSTPSVRSRPSWSGLPSPPSSSRWRTAPREPEETVGSYI